MRVGPKSYRIGVIRKRKKESNLHPLPPSPHTHTPWEAQWEDSCLQVRKEGSHQQKPAGPRSWTFQPPELWENKFLVFEPHPPSLWCLLWQLGLTDTLLNPLGSSFCVGHTTEAAPHNCPTLGPCFKPLPPWPTPWGMPWTNPRNALLLLLLTPLRALLFLLK